MTAAIPRSQPVHDALRQALENLVRTANLLQQNSEGCAVNHHGLDFEQQGLPGWLRDTKADIDAAYAALATPEEASTAAGEAIALDHNSVGKAAEAIFDYCDNNLSMIEACDMNQVRAQQLFDAAKILRNMFSGEFPAVPPAAQTDGVREALERARNVLSGPFGQGGESLMAIGEAYGILDDALALPRPARQSEEN